MADLTNIPSTDLVAELERRGFFSRWAALVDDLFPRGAVRMRAENSPAPWLPELTTSAVPTPPPVPTFYPGTQREVPKGTVKVEEVPGHNNKDGSPLRVASVIPKELQDRLTFTSKNIGSAGEEGDPLATGPGGTRTIVRGDERRALAQSFIDAWESDIAALENRLRTEVLPQEEIDNIHGQIRRLQRDIALRKDSAFGGLTLEDVMARNEAANPGRVSLAEVKPGVAGQGIRLDFKTGIMAIDTPEVLEIDVRENPDVLIRLKAVLPADPHITHLERPVVIGESGTTTNVRVLTNPLVLWRIWHHVLKVYKDLRQDASKSDLLKQVLERGSRALHRHGDDPAVPIVTPGTNPEFFKRAWTGYLQERYAQGEGTTLRALKTQIRIWNPDFAEKEAPDEFFDMGTNVAAIVDQGERQVEHRPHVDTRAAWSEKEEGPGVFRMKRGESR